MPGVTLHQAPALPHRGGCFTSRLPARRPMSSALARQHASRQNRQSCQLKPSKCRATYAKSSCRSPVHPTGRRTHLASKSSPFLENIVGQRFLSVASRKYGSKTIVAVAMVGETTTPMDQLLKQDLQQAPTLHQGQLDNGLKYVLLPNKSPPERFEAHLEMHVGSVDERPEEQGIAHMVEHITFLGSKKRESLLGTGARSNAYTDFHHTVFHVHAPLINSTTQLPMLPQVLDVLAEVAFEAEFLNSRIEKERRAVMAEAQMMNTIEYRVDCQLLQYLHEENDLGFRFPIGKMEQVQKVGKDVLHGFWSKWYFPANATLYMVGDFENGLAGGVPAVEDLIRKTFGSHRLQPGRQSNGAGPSSGPLKQRHEVRPPVVHKFGCGPLQPGEQPPGVSMFRHRLLQHFMLSLFCKLPVQPMNTMAGLRQGFVARIMLSVLQFRINQQYTMTASPPFISVEMDHSDSAREGCTVSTLTITSEPKDWKDAIKVAVQEVRRLQKHGVTNGELDRYKACLLRDSQHLAEQWESVPSVDNLDYCMECLALDHTFMAQEEGHVKLLEVADSITAQEVNAVAASVLSYISHYRNEEALLAEAASDYSRNGYAEPGPTRMTSIVACVPAYMDASGQSTGGAAPMQRGASMTTSEHIDPSIAPANLADMEDSDQGDIPEGVVRFDITAEEIADAIAAESLEVEARADVDVPDRLISEVDLQEMIQKHQPRFVPVEGSSPAVSEPPSVSMDASKAEDPSQGIMQLRLSNGICINARRTLNEPKAAMLRMVAAGGKANNGMQVGPKGAGVVGVGVRTLNESGTVGSWDREQTELHCISKLINSVLEPDEEFALLDFHFAVGDGGLQSVLELVHLLLDEPCWEEAAMERAKQVWISNHRSLTKSLERSTADRVMEAMLGPDRRFRDPNPEEIQALSLEGMRETVMSMLHPENIEINLTGDFDPAEFKELALKYLGTVAPRPQPPVVSNDPVKLLRPATPVRIQWHLKDSDERACALIAGQAPARWFSFGNATPGTTAFQAPMTLPRNATQQQVMEATRIRRSHPLYPMVTLNLLTEIINGRLFTTVRDSLGLTYDVSFEIASFDRLGSGWYVINVTSTPDKIQQAMDASLRVLRNMQTDKVTSREVLRARRTLLTRHESDLKDNLYWLGLLTHLQSSHVPGKTLDVLRDLIHMYEVAAPEDLAEAISEFDLDDHSVYTCIGVSGKRAPTLAPFEVQNHGNLISAQQATRTVKALYNNGKMPSGPQEAANAMIAAFQAVAQSGQLSGHGDRD